MNNQVKTSDFNAIKLKLASPEVVQGWSNGEITRPETINYRTQKPEKDGLFCEKIFGPTKDWECYCGKYKKIRYKGIVCDKCGVEVTRSIVRRERMGHIELKAPVSHIWFLRGVPSKIGSVLDMSVQTLEKIIYFANFVITKVDENLKKEMLEQIKQEFKSKKKQIESEFQKRIDDAKKVSQPSDAKGITSEDREIVSINSLRNENIKELEEAFSQADKELKELKVKKVIPESVYHDLSLKYGHVFEANIGAEAVHYLLQQIDLEKMSKEINSELEDSLGSKKEKLIRRLKLINNFKKNNIHPSWMVLTMIPVIPPDLRPMVPLDGGRFATSDLNDLYRRVINRNNRLKQLIELNAPEVICRNEKRMLQEAVDALIDNSSRHGKTVVASTGQKRMLKSLADMLKGKQGRFRQNLLGKRTDYSGRSVIVVGPTLKIYECGLPKTMALELFRPFIISKLIKRELVHNVRSANRFIESKRSEVWDILEEVIKGAYVLLNRAPTLHRLGIQAFKPRLIEGKAIQIHPLVCTAFNADFDGDQMAVHVPLTKEAVREAKEIMLSSMNLLKPATGDPVISPNQDVVWGAFYMTFISDEDSTKSEEEYKKVFMEAEAEYLYSMGYIGLNDSIKVKIEKEKAIIKTSVGRVLFNKVLPPNLSYVNDNLNKKKLSKIISDSLTKSSHEETVKLLDDLKEMCFKYLTRSGLSWGMNDLPEIKEKKQIIEEAEEKIDEIQNQFDEGLLTKSEKFMNIVSIWTEVKDRIEGMSKGVLDKGGSVYSMIDSGARGSWGQLTQIIGMKGLVANPAGEIIELPVKGNFKEGFDVIEFFISTHGTRKGLSDTALRTANAGYLTRRLIDVSQDVVICEEDCGDNEGFEIPLKETEEMGETLEKRILGRFALEKVVHPKTKKVLIKAGELITEEIAEKVAGLEIEKIKIHSLLTCKTKRGACQKCYGYDLGFNRLVKMGTAVGIIAAQSIGEPGTQLTMRTFHTGGVAGGSDITQGLPRVEEIFEARPPKMQALLSDVAGLVSIKEQTRVIEDEKGEIMEVATKGQKIIQVAFDDVREEEYKYAYRDEAEKEKKYKLQIKDGQKVKKGALLFRKDDKEVLSKEAGEVKIEAKVVKIIARSESVKEFVVPQGYAVWVNDGDLIDQGSQLTEGALDLQQLFRLRGKEVVQRYIIKEIQYIYSSQGQKLNDKHIELIARQMFSRVYIKDAGDTDLLPGEIVERAIFLDENERAKQKGGTEALGDVLLLGMTKSALTTDSFLSAASFQETARVLINAAVTGKVDRLLGLKENVIIGRLIPAGTGHRDYNHK